MKLKRIFAGILLLAAGTIVLSYNACSRSGSMNFSRVQGTTITGNPFSGGILQALCSKVSSCDSGADYASCLTGVLATGGIDFQLGLPLWTYPTYSTIESAEQSGSITANATMTNNCVTNIAALGCTDSTVIGAYNPTASNPWAGVASMIPLQNGGCTDVYSIPPYVWRQITPTAMPPAINQTKSAYDPIRKITYIYGGDLGTTAPYTSTITGQMWKYDGTTWTEICANCAPGPRRGHGLAYDSKRDRLVLIGGGNGTTQYLGDTWEFDGTNWTQVFPGGTGPGARREAYVAYDSKRGRTVLFGGDASGTIMNDTYEYDGVSWTGPISSTTSPSARHDGAMSATYDSIQSRMLIYGSRVPASGTDDMWAWDGANWRQVCATCTGKARSDAPIAFDPVRNKIVIINGFVYLGVGNYYEIAGTWEMDGATNQWTEPYPLTPSARDSSGFVWDSTRSKFVFWGGTTCAPGGACNNLNDTWEYGP